MTEKENLIEELGKLPETIEDIERDPILKPLLDYNKAALSFTEEDKSESIYLDEKIKALNEVLKEGIYENSLIARHYNDVLEVYKRLLFIFSRYTQLADKQMGKVKEIVRKYYITDKKHLESLKEEANLQPEIERGILVLEEEVKGLKEENKILKKELREIKKKKKPAKENPEADEEELKREFDEN